MIIRFWISTFTKLFSATCAFQGKKNTKIISKVLSISDDVKLGKNVKLFMTPWVRLYRHTTNENESAFRSQKLVAIDIVHKNFFNIYTTNVMKTVDRKL